MKGSIIAILVLVCVLTIQGHKRSFPKDVLKHDWSKTKPIKDIRNLQDNITVSTITQKLDHFNPSDNRTIQLEYYSNNKFFKPNGPIFMTLSFSFYPVDIQEGHMYEMASDLGAHMVLPEIRFINGFMRNKNISMETLQYVSFEQRLEDLIHLIKTLKQEERFSKSKVIVFGCGKLYGTLTTWIRSEYPDVVDGAVASSAPVNVKADFPELLNALGEDILQMGGQECYDIIHEGLKATMQLVANNESQKFVEYFHLCRPQSFKLEDISLFMINNVIRTFLFDTYDVCPDLLSYPGTPLEKLSQLLDYGSCIPPNVLGDWTDDLMEEGADEYGRINFYTTCSEIGLFVTSNSNDSLFANSVPLSFYTEHACPTAFDASLYGENVVRRIQRINQKYGGLTPNVTKVVSVHGSRSELRLVGIVNDLNPESPAIVIEGEDSCEDAEPSHPSDSAELKAARQRIRELVTKWIH